MQLISEYEESRARNMCASCNWLHDCEECSHVILFPNYPPNPEPFWEFTEKQQFDPEKCDKWKWYLVYATSTYPKKLLYWILMKLGKL